MSTPMKVDVPPPAPPPPAPPGLGAMMVDPPPSYSGAAPPGLGAMMVDDPSSGARRVLPIRAFIKQMAAIFSPDVPIDDLLSRTHVAVNCTTNEIRKGGGYDVNDTDGIEFHIMEEAEETQMTGKSAGYLLTDKITVVCVYGTKNSQIYWKNSDGVIVDKGWGIGCSLTVPIHKITNGVVDNPSEMGNYKTWACNPNNAEGLSDMAKTISTNIGAGEAYICGAVKYCGTGDETQQVLPFTHPLNPRKFDLKTYGPGHAFNALRELLHGIRLDRVTYPNTGYTEGPPANEPSHVYPRTQLIMDAAAAAGGAADDDIRQKIVVFDFSNSQLLFITWDPSTQEWVKTYIARTNRLKELNTTILAYMEIIAKGGELPTNLSASLKAKGGNRKTKRKRNRKTRRRRRKSNRKKYRR